MPSLPPSQQHQSTEGKLAHHNKKLNGILACYANNFQMLLLQHYELCYSETKQVSQLKQGLADRTAKTAVSVAI